jgi:putative ABC transport system ATP-binding protein
MIELRSVGKVFETPAGPFAALRAIDLDVAPGEFVCIVGRSGSGKSTLLNLIAGLDRPTAGSVRVGGTAIHGLGADALATWRARAVGVVFQSFQLLPTLTVAENVMLPMDLLGTRARRERRAHALRLLAAVGIGDQADKLPLLLSGGQQQRAAIARALANDPPVVVADEPTGNLDSATARTVFELFHELTTRGTTVVVATHERGVPGAPRVLEISDGAFTSSRAVAVAAGAVEGGGA